MLTAQIGLGCFILKYTKFIIQYYDAVSQYILPYLKNCPQSMNRFANGITGSVFIKETSILKNLNRGLKQNRFIQNPMVKY